MKNWILNLRLSRKFLLIGLVALLMVSLPTALVVTQKVRQWRTDLARVEVMPAAAALLQLVRTTQQHRGLSNGFLGGVEAMAKNRQAMEAEVNKALGAALDSLAARNAAALSAELQDQQKSWKSLAAEVSQKSIASPASFARHTELIARQLALLEALADARGLARDDDPAHHHTVMAVLSHLPQLTETLGQMRARGAFLLGRGEASSSDKASLQALLQLSQHHMHNANKSLDKAMVARSDLGSTLAPPLQTAKDAATHATGLARTAIIDAEALSEAPTAYFGTFTQAIDLQFKLIDTAFASLDAALRQRASAHLNELAALAAAVLVLGSAATWVMVIVSRGTTRDIRRALDVANTVASGDLSSSIAPGGRDEAGQLLEALRTMNGSLVRIVQQVRQGSDNIASASSQIASGNADLSQRTESQAANLEETAASMQELTGAVQQSAETAQQASHLATQASKSATQGGQIMAQMLNTMEEISASSRRIDDITSVIDGIAFQTNILALNAAVEAARAGEQGRGFAVVATEVRTLAKRSADAAKEIKTLIGASVERIGTGAELATQAGDSVNDIVHQVQRVSDLIAEISTASLSQSSGIAQIGAAISQLDQATQQNASLVEESANAADSLSAQARQLSELVGVFRVESRDRITYSG